MRPVLKVDAHLQWRTINNWKLAVHRRTLVYRINTDCWREGKPAHRGPFQSAGMDWDTLHTFPLSWSRQFIPVITTNMTMYMLQLYRTLHYSFTASLIRVNSMHSVWFYHANGHLHYQSICRHQNSVEMTEQYAVHYELINEKYERHDINIWQLLNGTEFW